MKKHLSFLYLFLLGFSTYLWGFEYELSLCAIFKDEAPYLQEWIEYHRMLGVQHFWLYNNESSDHYEQILQSYIQEGIVEVIDWPGTMDKKWTPQIKAYNDGIARSKNITHWLAIIDVDEFIVPVYHDSIQDLLKNYPDAGGLQIFWQFFGTSGIYELPPHQMITESLVLKGHFDLCNNYKTICQPHTIKTYRSHEGDYYEPWFPVFPDGNKANNRAREWPLIQLDIVQINHYWTRDEKYFREKKLPRNRKKMTEDIIQSCIQQTNQELDETILRFVPALKQRLESLQHKNENEFKESSL